MTPVTLDQLNKESVFQLRQEFPSLNETVNGHPIIFFDGPGGTQVHGSVIEAMAGYFEQANSNAHGAFTYSQRTDETVAAARAALADLLNAGRPEEIVFGANMTTLTFHMSRCIGRTLTEGDEIVVTHLDHDGNISPWLALQEQGAVVRWVDFTEEGTLDMAGLEAAINARTKVIALGYASNALGTINDVKRAAELAHAAGAWLYVDAVHYAPHGPIDVQAIDCDFLVCSAYKFFGPHLGAVYGRYELLDELPAYKVRPADERPPGKFETGTGNFEGMAGTMAAVNYLASVGERFGAAFSDAGAAFEGRRRNLKRGLAAIRAYERELCEKLIAGLAAIPELHIYGLADLERLDERVPTVSFRMKDLPPVRIAQRLDQHNIFAWDGNFYALAVTQRLGVEEQGGLLRVGLAHYNTAEEVDTLLNVLEDMPR